MNLLNLFRPKWKHTNPEIRRTAVQRLEDQTVLVGVAQSDEDTSVRKTALMKIQDQLSVLEIARNEKCIGQRDAAERLDSPSLVAKLAMDKHVSRFVRGAAVKKLHDQKLLLELIQTRTEHYWVRSIAVENLDDRNVLVGIIADESEDREVRSSAILYVRGKSKNLGEEGVIALDVIQSAGDSLEALLFELAMNDRTPYEIRETAVACLCLPASLQQFRFGRDRNIAKVAVNRAFELHVVISLRAKDLESQGQFNEALTLHDISLALTPNCSGYIQRGQLLEKLGRYDEAAKSYELAARHGIDEGVRKARAKLDRVRSLMKKQGRHS